MDGWKDGGMERQIEGHQTNGYYRIHIIHTVQKPHTYTTSIPHVTPRYIHSVHTQCIHKAHMDRQINRRVEEWINEWTDGKADRWMHGQSNLDSMHILDIQNTHTQIHTQNIYTYYTHKAHMHERMDQQMDTYIVPIYMIVYIPYLVYIHRQHIHTV